MVKILFFFMSKLFSLLMKLTKRWNICRARYDAGDSVTKLNECQSTVTSPRPLGLLELSSGLALDRGPAFSPAQFSVGRRWLDQGNRLTPSSSRDSLPFAEEDASMVESPNWDPSRNVELVKQDSPR